MTSPPDVQNVPDVWGLLERAHISLRLRQVGEALPQRNEIEWLRKQLADAIAQRAEWQLVPKEPTTEQSLAGRKAIQAYGIGHGELGEHRSVYIAMLAAAPKPEGKT